MSFSKAQDLIRLAQLAAARRGGISLEEICAEFGVSHRTAQRMTDALQETFGNVSANDDEDRKRRWRLVDPGLDRLQLRHETGVEALEIAVRGAEAEGRLRHARALADLRDGLLARVPTRARVEADAEAVLTAMGQVTRPGPRVSLVPMVLDAIIEALRGPFRLRVRYNRDQALRILEPHGVLLGHRTYLAARDAAKADEVRNFRIDLIHEAETLNESFALQDGFTIADYAAQSFGVWQDPAQYGEVIWRFVPEAAERAAGFRFHPHQTLELQDDGSLIVRFHAAGWVEMTWHLYQWGDKVEILAPEALRKMVEGHRRSDFAAMP
ncbi:DeoR family transcriptional regulator [Sinorhizobium fredii USDA 205]|uniref:WYL domain-containing protein n=1 Tax=Rhizobium fredii TaxID=380 RepID=A0A844AGY1_RHIFR|nr:WYL domain-containing protein [Sinorhizobium fredii]KSV87356.1 DeoR family transcriptional regulator [Sinorhizobium fredii USDA 205]MQX11797.1 WYL domain-containing protein [Sinorhizobium fredii]GEC31699.1 WYL domain-containing protein [Sinorhizobium fredii]GLS09022.1 WYL domain-containing protein [Sinorhizobium fredii]